MPQPPAAILWDWDNTLADGWAPVTAALNTVFDHFGMAPWTEADTRARVRHSMRESFPPLFGDSWRQAAAMFTEAFARAHLQGLRAMPGIAPLLDAARPWPLAIVSNKDGAFVRRECAALGWSDRFASIIGAGDAAADKPDPAPFHLALAPLGRPPGPDIWYVGDTGLDMQAARGCGCVAVLLGDAAHDGGMVALEAANCTPDLQFIDAEAMAAYLAGLV